MKARTIRLFVSSTFADMKAERDILQRGVFPHLSQLCAGKGFSFQAIDLRWGVSEEASDDNSTMRICLRELRRCLSAGTKPNFLILLGDRYGWRPLPEVIPASVVSSLFPFIPTHLQRMFEEPKSGEPVEKWYRCDHNAVPPVYELQPRGGVFNFEESVETPLLAALSNAAAQAGIDAAGNLAVGVSATEQEITEGALAVVNAREHVHAFLRTVPTGLARAETAVAESDVVKESALTSDEKLGALKARLRSHLGSSNVHCYSVSGPKGSATAEDLTLFAARVLEVLESVVLHQISALTTELVGSSEGIAHRGFIEKEGSQLALRESELRLIDAHIESRDPTLLAIVGRAGMGKSALLAQAAYRSQLKYEKGSVFARFIGLTPDSTQLATLLRDLVNELWNRYPEDSSSSEGGAQRAIPYEIPELVRMFDEALRRANMEKPFYLFLDGIDRLLAADGSRSLFWLPFFINPAVRFVVSTDDSEEETTESHQPTPLRTLMARQHGISILRLNPLPRSEGEKLLKLSMDSTKRCLQSSQQIALLDAFEEEGNPLWMTIAAAQASRLRSWDPPQQLDTSLPGLIHQVLADLADERRHGRTLVEYVARYLGCARDGMTEEELVDLLSNSQDVMRDFRRRHPKSPPVESLPASVWTALLGDLGSFLTERQIDGVAILLFQHRHFVNALDGFASFSALTCHRTLAAFFKKQFDLNGVQAIRALRELPYQQRRSEMWEELFGTLISPIFVEGRLTPPSSNSSNTPSGRLYSLLEEFESAAKEIP